MSSASQYPSTSQRPIPILAGSSWSTSELRYYHVRDRVSTSTKPQFLEKYLNTAFRRFQENASFGTASSMLQPERPLSNYSQLNLRRECPVFSSVFVALAELADQETSAEEVTSRVLRPIASPLTLQADQGRSVSSGSSDTSPSSSQDSYDPGGASTSSSSAMTETVANAVGILFLQAVTEEARLTIDEGSAARSDGTMVQRPRGIKPVIVYCALEAKRDSKPCEAQEAAHLLGMLTQRLSLASPQRCLARGWNIMPLFTLRHTELYLVILEAPLQYMEWFVKQGDWNNVLHRQVIVREYGPWKLTKPAGFQRACTTAIALGLWIAEIGMIGQDVDPAGPADPGVGAPPGIPSAPSNERRDAKGKGKEDDKRWNLRSNR